MKQGKEFIVLGIPAYNEEKTIAKIIVQAKKFVDHIIVCDDGSNDMTFDISKSLGVDTIKHESNKGKGMALKSIFKKALEISADVLITIDADDQHDPNEIPKFLDCFKNDDVDVVNGSRFINSEKSMPKHRAFGNKILTSMTNINIKNRLTDTQSGFRCYNSNALQSITITQSGMGVDSEIVIDLDKKNFKIIEIPISVRYYQTPRSRSALQHGGGVFMGLLKSVLEKKPLQVFGSVGAVLLAIGVIFGIRVLELFLVTEQTPVGTAILAIGFGVVGIITIFVGGLLYVINKRVPESNQDL